MPHDLYRATNRDQDAAPDDEVPITGTIGWMAFLRAPHIPIAAFEHD